MQKLRMFVCLFVVFGVAYSDTDLPVPKPEIQQSGQPETPQESIPSLLPAPTLQQPATPPAKPEQEQPQTEYRRRPSRAQLLWFLLGSRFRPFRPRATGNMDGVEPEMQDIERLINQGLDTNLSPFPAPDADQATGQSLAERIAQRFWFRPIFRPRALQNGAESEIDEIERQMDQVALNAAESDLSLIPTHNNEPIVEQTSEPEESNIERRRRRRRPFYIWLGGRYRPRTLSNAEGSESEVDRIERLMEEENLGAVPLSSAPRSITEETELEPEESFSERRRWYSRPRFHISTSGGFRPRAISTVEEEATAPFLRVTCDILGSMNVSYGPFGLTLNHAACGAHCLAKGYRGGWCNNQQVCNCRR